MSYLSYEPFYFDPDDLPPTSDVTCWWVDEDPYTDSRFVLCTGDAESWESLHFLSPGQDETGAWSGVAGQPFWNPTRTESYPWLGWVIHRSGGLDV